MGSALFDIEENNIFHTLEREKSILVEKVASNAHFPLKNFDVSTSSHKFPTMGVSTNFMMDSLPYDNNTVTILWLLGYFSNEHHHYL
jgi:hypothetical protein